jgi:hypothetical protein
VNNNVNKNVMDGTIVQCYYIHADIMTFDLICITRR